MKFTDFFFNYFTRRNYMVRKCIYIHQDYYYQKLDQVKEKYFKIFYEQTIACVVADAYELFLELHKANNPFFKNIDKLTEQSGQAFYRSISTYYTLSFIGEKAYEIDEEKMEEVLFSIFDFCEKDQQTYYDLKALREMEESIYEIEFGKYLMKEVFDKSLNDIQLLAQIYHCLYYSYESFRKSLSAYTTIESKLA